MKIEDFSIITIIDEYLRIKISKNGTNFPHIGTSVFTGCTNFAILKNKNDE